jgi:HSP20 family protein
MAVERWDPFRDVVSLRDAMSSLLQESFVRPPSGPGQAGPSTLALDVAESENEFVIHASLPGVKPEDLQISVHGDVLTIRGESKFEEEKKGHTWHLRERRHGMYQRSLSLGTPVNADKANARFEQGVLTLTLPKSEAAQPKQIKVGGPS